MAEMAPAYQVSAPTSVKVGALPLAGRFRAEATMAQNSARVMAFSGRKVPSS